MFFSFLAIFQLIQCVFLILHVFSLYLAIFQVLPYEILIFLLCQFSRHNPGPTVCVSHVPRCSVFLPYSRSNIVCVSFSMLFSFLAILQVLQCTFIIFHVFHSFSLYSRSYHVSFSFSFLVSFLAIFQVIQCTFLIFHVFQYFSP